jgi:hypothetical protein
MNGNEECEAYFFYAYSFKVGTWREGVEKFRFSRSTFFRRLKRFRGSGSKGLIHKLRGVPSQRAKAYYAVRRQVLALYQKGPSLFCSYFYKLNRRKFLKPVAYSTVRRWLREEGLLRRFPNGVAVTQPIALWGRICESQPIENPWPDERRKWRRTTPWEVRERERTIWLGWEKPLKRVPTPTAEELASFAQHVEDIAPRTPWIRANWVPPETPYDAPSRRE